MSRQKGAPASPAYGAQVLAGCVPWWCLQPVYRLHVATDSNECSPPQNRKCKSCEVSAVVFVFGCMSFCLFQKNVYFNFICMSLLPSCLCTMCMQSPRWPEEGTGCLLTGVTDAYDLLHECWKLKPGPLEEQAVLSHLSSLDCTFFFNCKLCRW